MNVIEMPFNKFIGLRYSDQSNYLLMLDNKSEYRNHLDTVHASALFALAEATSGYYLLGRFSELSDIIPVVRKVDLKYRKPVVGKVFSNAKLQNTDTNKVINDINQKGRTLLEVEVSLFNEDNALVMQSVFEWFITKKVD